MFGGSVQNEVSRQGAILSQVPSNVWYALPASITFAAVRYVEGIIVPMLPNPSGTVGSVLNALIGGALTATNMVVWDTYKSSAISSAM